MPLPWTSTPASVRAHLRRLPGMRPFSPRAALLRALALSAAGLAMACSQQTPATPAPATTATTSTPTPDAALPGRLVAEVTGDGAFRHLEELQRIADGNGGNRALGTPGYDASVEYVARTLRDAGYTVETPEFTARSFSVQDARLTVDGQLDGVCQGWSSVQVPTKSLIGCWRAKSLRALAS